MNLPDFSVRRPVFTSMVTLIVILLGLSSFTRLQIDMLPDVEGMAVLEVDDLFKANEKGLRKIYKLYA